MNDIREGDIVIAASGEGGQNGESELVLAFEVGESEVRCLLVTLRQDMAIELDLILPPSDTKMNDKIVIHNLAETWISFDRLSSPVGHCEIEILQALVDLRFGTYSGERPTGSEVMPFGDPRDRQLRSIYANFRRLFGHQQRPLLRAVIEDKNALGSEDLQGIAGISQIKSGKYSFEDIEAAQRYIDMARESLEIASKPDLLDAQLKLLIGPQSIENLEGITA